METLDTGAGKGDKHVEESRGGKSDTLTSQDIVNPVVYKLVRVKGDGTLIPATDDEVMVVVEDLLDDDKGGTSLAVGPDNNDDCTPTGDCTKGALEDTEGSSQSEGLDINKRKLSAKLEYIEGMLQKVKEEERLLLSCGTPDPSSKFILDTDAQLRDQNEQLIVGDANFLSEYSSQVNSPPLLPCLTDDQDSKIGSPNLCTKTMAENEGNDSSSHNNNSLKPDFSTVKGEICLDNLSIRELHETFKATFGRETSVKDKLWLKRRIAMGLTNSCNVSTTSFIIENKSLKKTNDVEAMEGVTPSGRTIEGWGLGVGHMGRNFVSGKRLRKPKLEYEVKNDDHGPEQTASKRIRKPTKRYIEELSEVEARECSGKLVSSVRNSGHGQSSPKSRVRPAYDGGSVKADIVARQDSLGGSGVLVPFVSRVRRGRPRKNFMGFMKYNSSGMAAKLVKKALGVRAARQDGEKAGKRWNSRSNSAPADHSIGAKIRIEKGAIVPLVIEGDTEHSDLDPADDESVVTVPTAKGGIRRKHHRAWTLCEVMKLVEGVSRYGCGRWSEIKRLAFASYTYRTSVDLKDKWRNLLRASYAQGPTGREARNTRKHTTLPIPAPILLRVRELAATHSQSAHDRSSSKPVGRSGRSVHKKREPDAYNCK
ncbi:uncharacterized protein LOC18439394 isoform X1 [Amborella trichopoda]|uniref:Uncharacterized protein n=1 Tax=Amborella trichopoda TaxID=13333 RepID=W1PTQ9_AMBTC|nr:uncharacterized protein LOC18439394 isoform X1 [Amborella trichopoda]XP_011625298.1 uncharacterized protein LOC18439394 isoform X1 [Amborella trichopoda]XP_020526080.1 uncharacterized protein LOC18439394 isoform X1 [Amborella trichopoda]XP_020526081.1 uncharacterized protein LOC18439394 isoform X1 [Amborella trichopoda]ERN11204.1 hypothetical protein AMTR_s00024p00216510 [Amborella trichopoda]|eukprot:XP_006849623.1 uncharacterized protein LOC18439394 isoform X1 [Amborella trichopoda]